MSLGHGRPYLAIPGPSVMPDRVLAAMHRAAPNIYAGPLHETTARIVADLRRVARTTAHVAIYIANGHGAWEAANANLFSRGDRALCAITGRFGEGWAASVARMGVRVDRIDFGRVAGGGPGTRDRLRSRDPCRHGDVRSQRHRRDPGGNGRNGPSGAARCRCHRLARL